MKPTILLVDDELDNLDALERVFRKKYCVLKASGAAEGLEILRQHTVQVIVSDQRMPKTSGVEFLRQSLVIQPDAMRLLLTGYTDIESLVEAINKGEIYRYMTKPWDATDLLVTVEKAVEKYFLRKHLVEKNQKLEAALLELKQLDDAKNEFMLIINHELKTPLTAISSYSQLLAADLTNELQKKSINRIQENVTRLTTIVDKTLLFTKAMIGTLPLESTEVYFLELINSVVGKYQNELALRNIKVDLIPPKMFDTHHPNILRTDKVHLQLALDELIKNCVEHSDPNTTMSIEIKNSFEMTIKNETQPMNESELDRIKKSFRQLKDQKNHSKGWGLGLNLASALIQALSGQLHISHDGKFLICTVVFPKSEVSGQPPVLSAQLDG
jgi:two-component system sensor histidine kinase/response regulator